MTLHLKITGAVLVLLALIHFAFPKYFNWKKELQALSLINRQMMEVHTFFVAFVVLLMGLLCIIHPEELTSTTLGKSICLGLGTFWLARLIIQFFGYSSKLWKGKRFETLVHVLFSLLWAYFSGVFFTIFFTHLG
jgi:hypothetical protein